MSNPLADVNGLAGIEDQLAATLSQVAKDLEHADSLELEQRAEMYTILQAIQADSRQHRMIIGQWVSDRPRGNVA